MNTECENRNALVVYAENSKAGDQNQDQDKSEVELLLPSSNHSREDETVYNYNSSNGNEITQAQIQLLTSDGRFCKINDQKDSLIKTLETETVLVEKTEDKTQIHTSSKTLCAKDLEKSFATFNKESVRSQPFIQKTFLF
ncbi:hypothetical protein HK096_005795 [Nowakowskiella sp. JEL0078]|nr:hypothetical protein HK096_005795 [Nowakowskiella sp. JEL0078]